MPNRIPCLLDVGLLRSEVEHWFFLKFLSTYHTCVRAVRFIGQLTNTSCVVYTPHAEALLAHKGHCRATFGALRLMRPLRLADIHHQLLIAPGGLPRHVIYHRRSNRLIIAHYILRLFPIISSPFHPTLQRPCRIFGDLKLIQFFSEW